MNGMLTMQDLSVGYRGQPLLKELALSIGSGEIFVLLGPNGSGKSTLLKAIVRELTPLAGTIFLEEKDLKGYEEAALAKELSVVLTERVKGELLTGYDLVAAGRYPYTGRLGALRKADEEKIQEALALVHAGELGPRLFSKLSDGQKQRLLLARAIAQDPKVLVLDEPTAYLDLRYQLEILTVLKRLAKERSVTIVLSLHEVELARRIADRLLLLFADHTTRLLSPQELTEEAVRELFEIQEDRIDPALRELF